MNTQETKAWLEVELNRAEEMLSIVEAKCAEDVKGYDVAMYKAHCNRVQGLKDTIVRLNDD